MKVPHAYVEIVRFSFTLQGTIKISWRKLCEVWQSILHASIQKTGKLERGQFNNSRDFHRFNLTQIAKIAKKFKNNPTNLLLYVDYKREYGFRVDEYNVHKRHLMAETYQNISCYHQLDKRQDASSTSASNIFVIVTAVYLSILVIFYWYLVPSMSKRSVCYEVVYLLLYVPF